MTNPIEQMKNVTQHLHGAAGPSAPGFVCECIQCEKKKEPMRFIPKHLRVPVVYEGETICTSPQEGLGRVEILDEWLKRFIGKRVRVTVEEIL